jgi:hypothetical protein
MVDAMEGTMGVGMESREDHAGTPNSDGWEQTGDDVISIELVIKDLVEVG